MPSAIVLSCHLKKTQQFSVSEHDYVYIHVKMPLFRQLVMCSGLLVSVLTYISFIYMLFFIQCHLPLNVLWVTSPSV